MSARAADWTRRSPLSTDRLDLMIQKISELTKTSMDDDYIYRGEPKCFNQVSSSLYREFPELHSGHYEIERIQNDILQAARDFTGIDDDNNILSQLQHYGYSTNLIDFTTDINIAMFFACDGDPKDDGRVIFLRRSRYPLVRPKDPANRAIAQKSIFVQSPRGLVTPDEIVNVPHDLKAALLEYLDRSHGISISTIYNDLHGFIRYHIVHKSAYAEFYAGINHWLKGESTEAIQRYTDSIALNPRLTMSYNNRGAAYLGVGDYSNAEHDFSKAIELNPQSGGGFGNRALAYQKQGKYRSALRDFNRAIKLSSKSAHLLDARGTLYGEMGEFQLALADHDKAIELDPGSAAALSNRATTYKEMGELDLAIRDMDLAIELRPSMSKLYHNRASVLIELQEYDKAIDDCERAISLNPLSTSAHNNLGVAFLHRCEHEAAESAFSRAVELRPRNREAYYNRGENSLYLEQWDEAKRDFLEASSMGLNVSSAFVSEFGSIAEFEHRTKLQLPEVIRTILEESK